MERGKKQREGEWRKWEGDKGKGREDERKGRREGERKGKNFVQL